MLSLFSTDTVENAICFGLSADIEETLTSFSLLSYLSYPNLTPSGLFGCDSIMLHAAALELNVQTSKYIAFLLELSSTLTHWRVLTSSTYHERTLTVVWVMGTTVHRTWCSKESHCLNCRLASWLAFLANSWKSLKWMFRSLTDISFLQKLTSKPCTGASAGEKRTLVAHEILSTELTYMNGLSIIQDVFKKPLQASLASNRCNIFIILFSLLWSRT